mmetsp:Transcript_17921/g.33325  ORF Transcript_17921/g.33325 Transcript_17921/m.33325 type:complete len:134 (-) Transcript_17921:23-424(-)
MLASDSFLEHATVHGNKYGTSTDEVFSKKTNSAILLLDIDVEGVKAIKAHVSSGKMSSARFLFISPLSLPALEARLRARGTEDEDNVKRRLGNAAKEIEYGKGDGNFDKVVVNDDLGKAKDEFCGWIGGEYQL